MIILDTSVLSAVMLVVPDETVTGWLDRQVPRSLWITAITVYEIRAGIELLAEGRRRRHLEAEFARTLSEDLPGRVLPFDLAAAQLAGELMARRHRNGFTDDVRDTQIAGIALARRATIATRNERHFRDLGAPMVNPWTAD